MNYRDISFNRKSSYRQHGRYHASLCKECSKTTNGFVKRIGVPVPHHVQVMWKAEDENQQVGDAKVDQVVVDGCVE